MTKAFTPPSRKKFHQISLSMLTKQIILGSLLGDGSLKIAKNYKNARYSERHSLIQEEYLRWKYQQLKVELKGALSISQPEKASFSKYGKIIYQSTTNENLTILHHLTHVQNQKKIKRRWLNNLEALALAIWWCDDGSLNVFKKQGVFCTDSFSYQEHKLLVRYLEVDWGICCKIIENPVKNKQKQRIRIDYRLRFSTFEDLKTFFRLILPFIPVPSMLYKIMICYVDPEDQQRWISEVKRALPHFVSEITSIYEEPLQRYTPSILKGELTPRDVFYKTERFQHYSENDIVQ
jgi:hypothetical protein